MNVQNAAIQFEEDLFAMAPHIHNLSADYRLFSKPMLTASDAPGVYFRRQYSLAQHVRPDGTDDGFDFG